MNQRNDNYHTYKSNLDRGLNNLYLILCAGHGMSSVGDKPTTGSYRQV